MSEDFEIRVHIDSGVGVLDWAGATTPEALQQAVSLASDDVLLGRGCRRVEARIPVTDRMAVRALHLAGFRREGRLREAFVTPDGGLSDVYVYARLASDQVYGPGGFSAVMDSVLPTKRVIGHVVFTDDAGRVLLMETSYKDDWELPGGVVEPGETPREGAIREVVEELGVEVGLGYPALVDWMPPSLGWSDALEFIWRADLPHHDFTLPEVEIVDFHWVDPADVPAHTSELIASRIALVLAADTGFLVTENGVPITD